MTNKKEVKVRRGFFHPEQFMKPKAAVTKDERKASGHPSPRRGGPKYIPRFPLSARRERLHTLGRGDLGIFSSEKGQSTMKP